MLSLLLMVNLLHLYFLLLQLDCNFPEISVCILCASLQVHRFKEYVFTRQWHPTPVLLPGKIPWTEEPGRLQSRGLLRVGHD